MGRRLAAIFMADVVGFSRLMEADETGTLADLKQRRNDILMPLAAEYNGRIVKIMGDGALLEFVSAVAALEAAIELQRRMALANEGLASEKHIVLRIGINLGDVIGEGVDIYGDGVNIAARLEGIATPGGICISGKVYDEVRRRVKTTFECIGPQNLKNVSEPIVVHRVVDGVCNHALPVTPLVATGGRASIAVLPFDNIGGDQSIDYLCNGISEDIITELSRFPELLVIARNSSFRYRGQQTDVRLIGRDLGVRYVLEGSVRSIGVYLRITSQLVDASTGIHIWAERFDVTKDAIYRTQDEVATSIVSVLSIHVARAEVGRAMLTPPSDWKAHDAFLRGSEALNVFLSQWDVGGLYEARKLFEKSIEIDPHFARAYAALADNMITAWLMPFNDEYQSSENLARALGCSRRAIELDPKLPIGHARLANTLVLMREFEAGLDEWKVVFRLNANFTDWRHAQDLLFSGDNRGAITAIHRHMKLDPFYPPMASCVLGIAHMVLEQHEEAIRALTECVSRTPGYLPGRYTLAAALALSGRRREAETQSAGVLSMIPFFRISTFVPLNIFRSHSDADRCRQGLELSGFPL